MASVIASTPTERVRDWSGRVPLRARILAVNIIAILALAGGILYLDGFRGRQIDARRADLRVEVALIAGGLASGPDNPPALLAQLARTTRARLLVFRPDGALDSDSWALTGPGFALTDPGGDPLRRRVARRIDRVIDAITGVRPVPVVRDLGAGTLARWPEARAALAQYRVTDALRRAPDGAPILTAAAPLPGRGVLLIQADARDITYTVRDERLDAFLVFLAVLAFSLLLSTFLARTIAYPLGRLAEAATLVRAGRERAVVVPRLPGRRDEIGRLARAVSDMTAALRERIDATEAFAADVAHELKNPLASMRSALETFARVRDVGVRDRLLALMTDDVARLDRLISDISEASRLEAEISRARFVAVDLGALAAEAAEPTRGVVVTAGGAGTAIGDAGRLRQVVRNLVDNAVSFSPEGGTVALWVEQRGHWVELRVEDEGPGVPFDAMAAIFERFYSARPEGERFGKHSGLGLAIARAIVEAHGGTIAVTNRVGGGACFTVRLPAV